jgi:hypothetical protein
MRTIMTYFKYRKYDKQRYIDLMTRAVLTKPNRMQLTANTTKYAHLDLNTDVEQQNGHQQNT